MRAILLGATGLTGGLLLQRLLNDPVFTHIKLISRRPTGTDHPEVEEVLIDFADDAALKREVVAADVLFCCVGTTNKKVGGDQLAYRRVDFSIPVTAARCCAEQHIPAFVLLSAVGAHTDSRNFYLRLKGETETAVLQQAIPAIYIMRPSILLGNRTEWRPLEVISKPVMKLVSALLPGSLSKYKAIPAARVAAAMQRAAVNNLPGRFIWHYAEMNKQ